MAVHGGMESHLWMVSLFLTMTSQHFRGRQGEFIKVKAIKASARVEAAPDMMVVVKNALPEPP